MPVAFGSPNEDPKRQCHHAGSGNAVINILKSWRDGNLYSLFDWYPHCRWPDVESPVGSLTVHLWTSSFYARQIKTSQRMLSHGCWMKITIQVSAYRWVPVPWSVFKCQTDMGRAGPHGGRICQQRQTLISISRVNKSVNSFWYAHGGMHIEHYSRVEWFINTKPTNTVENQWWWGLTWLDMAHEGPSEK